MTVFAPVTLCSCGPMAMRRTRNSIVTASGDKTARLWDVASGRLIPKLEGHADNVNAVAYSPDGNRIATASKDKTVRLWDVASGNLISILSKVTPRP